MYWKGNKHIPVDEGELPGLLDGGIAKNDRVAKREAVVSLIG